MRTEEDEANLSAARWARLTEALAPRLLGPDDATGDALAEAVGALSHLYTRERDDMAEMAPRSARGGALAARLRFFLVRDLPKIFGPLDELRAAGALPSRRTWSVLDLGAGLGTTSLGVATYAGLHGLADRIEVTAIDREAACARIFEALAREASGAESAAPEREASAQTVAPEREASGAESAAHALRLPALAVRAHVGDFGRGRPEGRFDLIVMGLALNEQRGARSPADVAAWLGQLARASLADDGALVVIEPALREPSRFLHAVRDVVAASAARADTDANTDTDASATDGLRVFAPCVRRGPCPMLASPRDWCHEDRDVALPDALVPIARAAGLRWEGATYSYLVLRRDGRTRVDTAPGEDLVTLRVVSQPLKTKGKRELFLCGEVGGRSGAGDGRVRAARLDRHASDANAAFEEARRGDLLRIRWASGGAASGNDDRVRIGADTQVERD